MWTTLFWFNHTNKYLVVASQEALARNRHVWSLSRDFGSLIGVNSKYLCIHYTDWTWKDKYVFEECSCLLLLNYEKQYQNGVTSHGLQETLSDCFYDTPFLMRFHEIYCKLSALAARFWWDIVLVTDSQVFFCCTHSHFLTPFIYFTSSLNKARLIFLNIDFNSII